MSGKRVLAIVFSLGLVSHAKAEVLQPEGWHYFIAPYLWVSAINGSVDVLGRKASLDVSFIDIIKHLDFAFQGHAEAGFGRWTLMVDPIYLKVSGNKDIRSGDLRATSQSVLIDTGLYYRFYAHNLAPDRQVTLEALAGGRYFGLKNTIQVNESFSVSAKNQIFAPLVGGRLKVDLTSKVQGWFRADGGGFHVDSMKQTWSINTGLAYAYSDSIDLGIAYKVLNMVFAKSDISSMNLWMHGPMLGIGYHG